MMRPTIRLRGTPSSTAPAAPCGEIRAGNPRGSPPSAVFAWAGARVADEAEPRDATLSGMTICVSAVWPFPRRRGWVGVPGCVGRPAHCLVAGKRDTAHDRPQWAMTPIGRDRAGTDPPAPAKPALRNRSVRN